MNLKSLKKQLIMHEGLRLKPYQCPAGFYTIGIGRNLESNGISESEALVMLDNDIEECIRDIINIFPDWYSFSVNRQHAIIDMRFNLGLSRFRQFKKMIAAVNCSDWHEAAIQAKDSRWYRQVGLRAVTICAMLEDG